MIMMIFSYLLTYYLKWNIDYYYIETNYTGMHVYCKPSPYEIMINELLKGIFVKKTREVHRGFCRIIRVFVNRSIYIFLKLFLVCFQDYNFFIRNKKEIHDS